MQITDFQRSYVRWSIDTTKKEVKTVSQKLPMTLNNVRGPLEATAIITDKESRRVNNYVLTASCKSEQVWVKRDIWHQPNADMCMVAGEKEMVIYKRWDKTDKGVMRYPESLGVQPERQLINPEEVFQTYSLDIVKKQGRLLENVDEILKTLFSGSPVVAQTEYEKNGYNVLLEYPVKIVNFSEREQFYQVDTGPVLLPDLEGKYNSLIEGCRHAFVAHNCADWAEFVVCVPTVLADGIKVWHYSEIVRIDGTVNRMIAEI